MMIMVGSKTAKLLYALQSSTFVSGILASSSDVMII